jgi:hypothetical protein
MAIYQAEAKRMVEEVEDKEMCTCDGLDPSKCWWCSFWAKEEKKN